MELLFRLSYGVDRARAKQGAKRRRALLLALGLASLAACSDSTSARPNIGMIFGDPVAVGSGSARGWVYVDTTGVPSAVGVTLTASALSNLPTTSTQEYMLTLPTAVSAVPFDHVMLNWNPHGHEPWGTYGVPHFDFHFFIISEQESAAIDTSDPEFYQKAARQPASEFIPAGYEPTTWVAAKMGTHWADAAAPENNGQPFTVTFIYGFYDGAMDFLEPMITKEFLESKTNLNTLIKLPARYVKPGYYPRAYSVTYDPSRDEYQIALTGLVMSN